MRSNARAVSVLRAVAHGATLAEAGKSIGVSGGRARQLLSQICRKLKLPQDISEIKRGKDKYLQQIETLENNPITQLSPKIACNLADALGLEKVDHLTPKYLSNISASQLLKVKQTLVAVAEAQEWLVCNGTSLKRQPPKSSIEVHAVRRAIATLDAFQFDTAVVRSQFQYLQNSDG